MSFSSEAKVGLIIIAGFVLLTYMTFTVSGWRWGTQKGYVIHAEFDSVAGLDAKSPVKLAGVEVGKVDAIRLHGNRARVTLRIQPQIQIPHGSKGAIRSSGLLGEKYFEIIPGSEEGYLEGGEEIEDTLESASLEALIGKFGALDIEGLISQLKSVFDDLKAVTTSLRGSLGTPEGEESLKEIVFNIRELTAGLSRLIKDNQEGVSASVDNIRIFTAELKDGVPGIIERIDSIAEKFDTIAARLEEGEGTLGKLLTEESVYDNLDSALANLDTISGRLESGEGTIGKLLTDEKAYEQLTVTLEGLSEAVSRLTETRVYVNARNEYQLEEGENKGYFTIRIDPRVNKSYYIELVDDPRGEVTETITQIDGGQPVSELKIKRKLKISALFAKRFWDFTLRAGLMESTFGVGAEYALFNDHISFGMDIWDFNSDDPQMDKARLKAIGRYTPFKYIFVQGGYDNILNKDIDTFFVGAGFEFEDEDLKYLMGSSPISLR